MGDGTAPAIPPDVGYQAAITRELLSKEATRVPTLRLLKEANPNLQIAELDHIDRVQAAMAPGLKKVEEAEKRLAEREAAYQAREERDGLVQRGIVGREQFPDVEKFQAERQIGKFADAAELYALQHRAAEPRSAPMGGPFTLPGTKELFENRTQWARKVAHQVLNEARGRR